MATRNVAQLNIRSDFAKGRALELARKTGLTTTQVVEEALRAYAPVRGTVLPVGRLIEKDGLLVMPADGRPPLTVEEVQASIDAAREERMDWIG